MVMVDSQHAGDLAATAEQGLALLRAYWPIQSRIFADGTHAAVFRCPVVRIENATGAPDQTGAVWTCAFGFRPDGTPVFAKIESGSADQVSDAALLAAADEEKEWSESLSNGLRFAGLQAPPDHWMQRDSTWRGEPTHDDLTVRDAYACWLRQQLGETAADESMTRAATLHLESSPLQEVIARFEAGPAMRLLNKQHWYRGRTWLALNGANNGGTPALALCDAWPIFADTIIRHVGRHSFPEGQQLGAAHVAEAVVTSSVYRISARRLGLWFGPGEHAPAGLVHVVERMRGLDSDVFAPFPAKSITTQHEVLFFLAALPPDWCPDSRVEWERVAQVARELLILVESYGASVLLLAQGFSGSWSDWVDGVLRALGTSHRFLSGGMINVSHATQAFSSQVLSPLLQRARRGAAPGADFVSTRQWDQITHETLFARLPAAAVFQRAARWHAQSENMEAQLSMLPAGTAASDGWPAAIPPAVIRVGEQDITLLPLTSRAMLVDEAGPGPDRDGVAGLNHRMAAQRHVEACRRGHRRIVSLRMRDAGGRVARLSTAALAPDFNTDADPGALLLVRVHRGRDGAAPPADAVQALDQYCASFRAPNPVLHVDREALADRLNKARLNTWCGYDTADDANILFALRLWDQFLPEHLRGLSPDEFTTAIGIPQPGRDGAA